jgi:hypothetical protein
MGAAFLSLPLAASKVGLSELVFSYLYGYIPVCCGHDGTWSMFANCWLLLGLVLTLTPTRDRRLGFLRSAMTHVYVWP